MEDTKKQPVQIIIQGQQHDISEEILEQRCPGYYSFRNNTHYISYEESPDNSEQAGPSGASLLKIKNNTVQILKKGAVTTRMEFDTQKNHYTSYHTPYGVFQLEISTEKLSICREGRDFLIHISYALHMEGQPLSKCSTDIQVRFETAQSVRLSS